MYNCDTLYGLTDDEKAANIGALLCNSELEYYEDKKELKKKLEKKKLFNLSNRQKFNIDTRDSIFKKLIEIHLDEMIENYSLSENLPFNFKNIAKEQNCIKILLKGFFTKFCNFKIDTNFMFEIEEITELTYLNFNIDTVYERVKEIQIFMHNKVQEHNGTGSHEHLDKEVMRNILATIRLNLNIFDIKNNDIQKIIFLRNKTKKSIALEYKKPSKKGLLNNQKFIPIWKAKKMKTLLDFMSSGFITIMNRISILDLNLSEDKFKEILSDIYVIDARV